MMQKIYLVKKDPQMQESSDNWIVMSSVEFMEFISTEEGQKRKDRFSAIDSCGCGDSIIVAETSERLRASIRSEHDRNTYLRRCAAMRPEEEDALLIRYSEDADQEREQRGRTCGSASAERPVEDEIIRRLDAERLRDAVRHLEDRERRLVMYCFLSDEPLSESRFGEMEGMSRDRVHSLRRRILRKLRRALEE